MAAKRHIDYPSDEEIIAGVQACGDLSRYAESIRINRATLDYYVGQRGLRDRLAAARLRQPEAREWGEPANVSVDGDVATIVTEASPEQLGDIDALIRGRGLDPDDWIVERLKINEWDAMGAVVDGENRIVRMRQLTLALRRKVTLLLASPAVHVPKVARSAASGKAVKAEPEYIVIESDHQAPYHDPRLHQASLSLLAKINPAEHILLGDLGDYPSISKFRDHPAAMASVNEVNQASYEILRDKREASLGSRCRLLVGNHGYRVEAELLARAERMYGVRPAGTGDGDELPALSLRRLLHLDALGIELVEDLRGWEHAEIEIVPGPTGLVARHGWITGNNTAKRSLERRGRSIICGHTHQPEHVFRWDPSAGCQREAVVIGCMCLTRDRQFPHFAVLDNWLQGMAVVSRWSDGQFLIEHVPWADGKLTWRSERFQ